MKHLCGALPDKDRTTLADGFPIGAALEAAHVDIEEL
jgi:hypothetical protein